MEKSSELHIKADLLLESRNQLQHGESGAGLSDWFKLEKKIKKVKKEAYQSSQILCKWASLEMETVSSEPESTVESR